MNLLKDIPSGFRFPVLALLLFLLVLPELFSIQTLDIVLTLRFTVWSIVTLLIMAGLLRHYLSTKKSMDHGILQRLIFPVFLLYVVICALSLFQAVNKAEALFELLKTSLQFLFFVACTLLLHHYKALLPTIAKVIITTTILLFLLGLFQYITIMGDYPSKFTALYAIKSTMAHKNMLTQVLFLSMPFAFYGLFFFRGLWQQLGIAALLCALTLIILLQTRSVWLALLLAVGMILFAAFVYWKKAGWKNAKGKSVKALFFGLLALVVVVMVVAVVVSQQMPISKPISERVLSITDPQQGTAKGRVTKWKESLVMIQDHPWGGIGLGNWKIVLPQYKIDRTTTETNFQRPHNDYLWVWAETGLLGLLAYLSIFGFAVYYVYRIIRGTATREKKLMAVLLFAGVAGYLTIAFFSFPKERIVHQVYLMILLANVVVIYHEHTPTSKPLSFRPTVAYFITCLLLAFTVYFGFVRYQAERYTKKALQARKAQNWGQVIREIDRAYSPFATIDPSAIPLKWYRGIANFALNNHPAALTDFKQAYDANPYQVYVLTNLASSYYNTGDIPTAMTYYEAALQIDPAFPDAVSNLVSVYYNQGKYREAFDLLDQLPNRTPDLEQKYQLLKPMVQ